MQKSIFFNLMPITHNSISPMSVDTLPLMKVYFTLVLILNSYDAGI